MRLFYMLDENSYSHGLKVNTRGKGGSDGGIDKELSVVRSMLGGSG